MKSTSTVDVHQFEDKSLAHYSYAVLSKGEVALIDPARDPRPYYEFASKNNAKISTIIETHPHADFVSSHLEIHKATGATIYVSKLLGADYPHHTFDEGEAIVFGDITLQALNTPGHSPDSISVVATDNLGKQQVVFTGDTLFIGDCGRPDLRESAGKITAAREDLARQMYSSLRKGLMVLPDEVLVYPAHGAGSLCGKGLSSQNVSTIGAEKLSNWSLQNMTEDAFVKELLADQPFVPKYFPFAVGINKQGAKDFLPSVGAIRRNIDVTDRDFDKGKLIIDARPQETFKRGHLPGAINLMKDTKFETWLGSIVDPEEPFYLIAENDATLNELVERSASIGYEAQIAGAMTSGPGSSTLKPFDAAWLRNNENDFTIVDIRNPTETKTTNIFESAIKIPLYELRERVGELPLGKPIVVHCAGGYRSAAGSSIIHAHLKGEETVYDLSEAVKTFQK